MPYLQSLPTLGLFDDTESREETLMMPMYPQEGGKDIFQTEMGDKEDFVLIGAGLPRTGTMSTR